MISAANNASRCRRLFRRTRPSQTSHTKQFQKIRTTFLCLSPSIVSVPCLCQLEICICICAASHKLWNEHFAESSNSSTRTHFKWVNKRANCPITRLNIAASYFNSKLLTHFRAHSTPNTATTTATTTTTTSKHVEHIAEAPEFRGGADGREAGHRFGGRRRYSGQTTHRGRIRQGN